MIGSLKDLFNFMMETIDKLAEELKLVLGIQVHSISRTRTLAIDAFNFLGKFTSLHVILIGMFFYYSRVDFKEIVPNEPGLVPYLSSFIVVAVFVLSAKMVIQGSFNLLGMLATDALLKKSFKQIKNSNYQKAVIISENFDFIDAVNLGDTEILRVKNALKQNQRDLWNQ